MPDNVNIHAAGSWLGDASEEFKKLPTWGKFVAAGVVLLVIGIAIYEVRKNASARTGSPLPVSGTDAASAGGTQSPFPMINGQPLLPTGTNPIYDGSGNVVGYQPQPTPPTTTPIPQPTPDGPASWLGNIPNFSKVWGGGLNPDGTQRWWFQPKGGQQTGFTLPKGTNVYAGGDGRWWYRTPGGQQTALTANTSSTTQPMVMSSATNPTVAPPIPKVS